MGLTDRQLLWRVELPLATPEIIAGLRIATVSTIAIATLAVFVSGGGLGEEIYKSLNFPTGIILGGGIAILMAIVFDAAAVPGPATGDAVDAGGEEHAIPARLDRRRDRIHLPAAALERDRRQDWSAASRRRSNWR